MILRKKVLVLVLVFFVFSFISISDVKAKHYYHGFDIETIYQTIKDSNATYDWDEEIVTFENEGMSVVCSLVIPKTYELCPIVVTLNGFAGDRNDMIIPGTDEPFFKRLSRILAENGFASFRIDFRGSGESDGDYTITTFSTQISDTLAAIRYIKRHLRHKVNTKSIGIVGFSQGGLVGSVVASRKKQVDALVLWSPVTCPSHCYEGLLTTKGIKHGLSLPEGGSDVFGLYLNGEYLSWDVPLGRCFFDDLYKIDPLAEIRKYKGVMTVIVGKNDPIVWPQPSKGNLFLKYHDGFEKLIVLNADHDFNFWSGAEEIDKAIYWSTATFIKAFKTH